jgi:uncharacterized RDD family membrane protein YckC
VNAFEVPTDPTAVIAKRYVAAVIDVGLGLVLYWGLFFVLSKPAPRYYTFTSNPCLGRTACSHVGDRYVQGGALMLLLLVGLAYMLGVFVIQRGLTGRTLGTSAMGLVTVDGQGHPLGIGGALVRSLAGIVDYVPCCWILPVVGIVTSASTKGHRRVGDLAARSFVVDKQFVGQPIVVPGIVPASPGGPYGQTYPQSYGQPMPAQPYGQAAGQAPGQPFGQAAGWGAPAPTPPTPTPPAAAPTPDPTQPQWDAQRGAYIQWDPTGQRWLQFDDATQQWRPIS